MAFFYFLFFEGFWLMTLKPFSGKVHPKIKSKIGHWKHSRKWFWSYLKVKNKCSEGSNVTFFTFFGKFWSDEVETVFREIKSDSDWFWSYLEVKKEFSKHLKMEFLIFLHIFQWPSWNCFFEKQVKAYETA